MSVCYHRFLEDLERGHLSHSVLPASPRSAMCFEMPPLEGMAGIVPVPELVKLPFEICWFEGDGVSARGDKGRIGFLLLSGEDHIALGMYEYFDIAGVGGGFHEMDSALFEGGQWKPHPTSGFKQFIPQTLLNANLEYVSKFLSLLNCRNVERTENKPSADHQKRRAKQGRVPLFSYWTLFLRPSSEKGESNGGTHATPRIHLRRGHIRRLSTERHIWVQACVVGNKERGMVHKDYALRHVPETRQ